MSIEKFKEFYKKHKWTVLGIGAGLLVILIVFLRSRGSSEKSKTTLDTIHQDLAQIDLDIEQIDSNLNAGPSMTTTSTAGNYGPETNRLLRRLLALERREETTENPPSRPPSSNPYPIRAKKGQGVPALSEEWRDSEYHDLEPQWSFIRFTDLFVPVNTTDRFEDVGARLN